MCIYLKSMVDKDMVNKTMENIVRVKYWYRGNIIIK